jgi:hypothetical protein
MKSSYDAFEKLRTLHKAVTKDKKPQAGQAKAQHEEMDRLEKKFESLEKGTKQAPGFGPINRDLGRLISSVESADIAPTQAVRSAVQQLCDDLDKGLQEFHSLNLQDVPALDTKQDAGKATPKNGCSE